MWAGVAGGMAEYFDVDPVLMRLIWVVATIVTAGLALAVYCVLWIIMPQDTDLGSSAWPGPAAAADQPTEGAQAEASGSVAADAAGWTNPSPPGSRPYGPNEDWYGEHRARRRRSAGIVLIALGLLFLTAQAGLFRWINWHVAWAVVLIVLGAALLLRRSDWRA